MTNPLSNDMPKISSSRLLTRSMSSLSTLMVCLLWCILSCPTPTVAQEIQYTENNADKALKSNARINPSTHAMELSIPLGVYRGRGGMNLPIVINYTSKLWRINHHNYFCANAPRPITETRAMFAEHSAAGWTSSLGVPRLEYTAQEQFYDYEGNPFSDMPDGCSDPDPSRTSYYVKRITMHLPDGSSHELRKDDGVYPLNSTLTNYDWTGSFYAVDGSRLIFNFDNNTLYLPDGGRYLFSTQNGYVTTPYSYIDRNGNTHNFNTTTKEWTDSMGRVIGMPIPVNAQSSFQTPTVGDKEYRIKTVGGVDQIYTLTWKLLKDPNTSESVLADPSQSLRFDAEGNCNGQQYSETGRTPALFTSEPVERVCGMTVFNPIVLAKITLPTGQFYEFKYNIYGEIERINYPSGGYERFEYAQVASFSGLNPAMYAQGNRGVTKRWVSAGGSAAEALWQYAAAFTGAYNGLPYKTTTTAPDGSRTEQNIHALIYQDSPVINDTPFGFGNVLVGMPYEERAYAPIAQGGAMLRRKLTEWAVTGSAILYSAAGRDPYVTKEVNIILDTGLPNALASATTYEYDTTASATFAKLNMTATNRHDFTSPTQNTAQSGAISSFTNGSLLRREETSYSYGAAYLARNMTSMPVSTLVKDASGNVVAKSEMVYDEAAYPLVWYGSMFDWINPGTSARGNVTTTKQWTNIATNTWVETHAQYDQVGNVRKSWDARGALSQVEYSSVFHYAYPTKTISAVPDPNNVTGTNTSLETTTDYEYTSGRVMSSTDANGKPTTFEYAATDHLTNPNPYRRLTKVNTPGGGYTSYAYGTGLSAGEPAEFVNTRTLVHATLETDSWAFSDGLGRPVRSFVNEAGTWLVSDTQYDSMGRVSRVSNPYRSTQGSDGPINPSNRWTTNAYDPLGRVLTVTTPDNAQVSTLYSGVTVTVTDQAGKKRRSVTDALGRLSKVTEAPEIATCQSDGRGCDTNYTYDVLGNLRRVEQGTQTRYFAYDSLSRLIRAKNPEQGNFTSNTDFPAHTDNITSNSGWSLGYTYDQNGNLLKRRDARNITTSYIYDNLNRSTRVDYSDGSFTERAYDNLTNGRGRFFYDVQHAPGNTVWEHKKVLAYDDAGRVLTQHQNFYQNGAWGPGYNTTRIYDKAGNVTSQIYPSGHTVNYAYDKAMRLDSSLTAPAFNGNLGDGVWRTYATDMEYDDASRISRETFGTQTSLYHKRKYNDRGQLYDVRLSSVNDAVNYNRGAILNYYSNVGGYQHNGTDNNGNVLLQQHFVPADDAISSHQFTHQAYSYDALNRLQQVSEHQNGTTSSFIQAYTYDRFGNRQINDTLTTANVNRTQFTIDTATNRINKPGDAQAMLYDNAGNLTKDTYTGAGNRAYDAEGRMTGADGSGYWNRYTYDADGKRTRQVSYNNPETWYVYGMDGELLAEYDALAPAVLAKKEYGYRNGELLISAESPAYYKIVAKHSGKCLDVDGTSNGGWAQQWTCNGAAMNQQFQLIPTGGGNYRLTARSSGKSLYVDSALTTDGARVHQWDYLSVDHQQWRIEPVGGGYQKLTAKHSAKAMEVDANSQADGARVQQWTYGGGANQQWEIIAASEGEVRWLVADHLGTPRIIADKSGSLAGIKRHDYLPFGEEIAAGTGGRTAGQGYGGNDGVRQKFTGQERDSETGLDYMKARYYASAQGRFTSVDPLRISATTSNPKTWNRYAYALNNPLRYFDPSGLITQDPQRRLDAESDFLDSPCIVGTAGCSGSGVIATINVVGILDFEELSTDSSLFNMGAPLSPLPYENPLSGGIVDDLINTSPMQTALSAAAYTSTALADAAYGITPDFFVGEASLPLIGGIEVTLSKDLGLYIGGGVGRDTESMSDAVKMIAAGSPKFSLSGGVGYFMQRGITPERRDDLITGTDLTISGGYASGSFSLDDASAPPALIIGGPASFGAGVSTSRKIYDFKK